MWIIRRGRLPFCSRRFAKKLLVYLFCRLVNCIYFALEFNTSYVAEWRGGGPHDLLRGFDSFRNCCYLWQQWLDLKPGGVFTLPFFYVHCCRHLLSQFLKGIDQAIGGGIMRSHHIIVLQFRKDLPGQGLAQLDTPLIERENVPDDPLDEDLVFI